MNDIAISGLLLVGANACVLGIAWIQSRQIADLRRQADDMSRAVTDLYMELPGHDVPPAAHGHDTLRR